MDEHTHGHTHPHTHEQTQAEATPAAGTGCFFCQTAKPLLEHLWSEVTVNHFRSSRIEFLKGLRSLIDDRIAYLAREAEARGTHVTVE
jgi:hypothetical protein